MNPLQAILILMLQVYRWILSPAKSAILGPAARCRYTPTCSAYALEAIQRHGAFHGSVLSVRRLCRCHPWGDTGFDPVPKPQPEGSSNTLPSMAPATLASRDAVKLASESKRDLRAAL